jgi:drug/metabolite transporter (DMT)-like permease
MSDSRRSHLVPVFQALFVTFLWSTSWILIKFGLDEIPSLTFAGLRYTLAFLVLVPVVAQRPEHRAAILTLGAERWRQLAVLGLLFYAVTQGAMFVALDHLPATPVSLILSFSPAAVALLAMPMLREFPTRLQWVGVMMFLIGVLAYFYPFEVPMKAVGLAAALIGLLTNVVSSVMGRAVNRRRDLHPLVVTVVSMGVGAITLLIVGLAVQGLPRLDWQSWGIVIYLALVNTALAFTLWNYTLQRLTAMESSILNNTMLLQIVILAWAFLGEPLGWKAALGIGLAAAGACLVQLRKS